MRATFLLQTPALNESSPLQSILLHAKLPQQRNSAGRVHCATACSQGPRRPVDLCAILRTAGLSATAVGNVRVQGVSNGIHTRISLLHILMALQK